LLHFPLLFLVLYGLVSVTRHAPAGPFFSLILATGGIFAFGIHTYFIKKGRPEFDTPMSKCILVLTVILSGVQLVVTMGLMIR
jgi:hypothetical protein